MDGKKPGTRKKIQKINVLDTIFEAGKIPPQAIDVEEAILGSLILEYNEPQCQGILFYLKMEHFYKSENQLIAEAIINLHNRIDNTVDLKTLIHELKKTQNLEAAGGPFYISQLMSGVSSSKNIQYHFRILYEQYLKRTLITAGSKIVKLAYDDSDDIFKLVDDFIDELSKSRPNAYFKPTETAKNVGQTFIQDFLEESLDHNMTFMVYNTNHKRFDSVVTISGNKIIVVGGAPKHGKSKFVQHIIFTLCDMFSDIAVYWVSLEDSRQDVLRTYLSSKAKLKPKTLQLKKYPKDLNPFLKKWVEKFMNFDIVFRDQACKSKDIAFQFSQFCSERPGKFHICVIDNVLTLNDKEDYKGDIVGMMDDVYRNILSMRTETHGLIFAVHHYNSEQRDEHHKDDGYRPRLRNLKGGEAAERTATQVILLNKPGKYKDLLAQYSGDANEILQHMMILDVGANRHDSDGDDLALIHMFSNLDFCLFHEIDVEAKESEPITKKDPLKKRGSLPSF